MTDSELKSIVDKVADAVVLVLSAALIAYISVDTFTGVEFMHDRHYMRFQFWVCVVFVASYFTGLWATPDRHRYVRRRWVFLLLSVPYLNILSWLDWQPAGEVLYFLRFVPLARGALAMSLVVGAVSRNRMTNVFASYTVILVAIVYFGSLIFYEQESPVNPQVPDFWEALWWASLEATTLGSDINPMTVPGKVLSCVIALMGMIMFPLFTVYMTDTVRRKLVSQRPGATTAAAAGGDSGAAADKAGQS